MAATWPTSLQQCLNQGDFSEAPKDTNIYTQPETGATKRRRRFTKQEVNLTASIIVNAAQYTTFKNFVEVTLKDRINPFDFEHPITGEAKVYKLAGPENIQPHGALTWRVSMQWIQVIT